MQMRGLIEGDGSPSGGKAGGVSIVIPVLHEAPIIREAVARIRALSGGDAIEILVVDGDPEGSTLRVIGDDSVRQLCARKGRGNQLNCGAWASSGEILLFLHADTALPPGALLRIAAVLRDPSIAGGAFALQIDSPRWVFRFIERATSLRSRLTRIPYGDQAIFLRRESFLALGGFRDLPLLEDVDLMRRLGRAGSRIEILSEPVTTSSRRWEKEGVFYTTFRNRLLMILFCLGVDVKRLARWYRPHTRA